MSPGGNSGGGGMTPNSQMAAMLGGSGPGSSSAGVMHSQAPMGLHPNLPNYFQQQQSKMMQHSVMSNGGMNSNSHGMGGPLMTSVMNGSGSTGQSNVHRNALIKPEPTSYFMSNEPPLMDLDSLTESSFPFDIEDFEASPMSRTSLTPVNTSRPPSASAAYSPLPTPLTPFQMQQPNLLGDPMQASPNGGGQTPNAGSYGGSTAGTSTFSFSAFGDDSQGSSTGGGKDKAGMSAMNNRQQQQQQQMMETTRLRNLLTNPQSASGGPNSVSPPSGTMNNSSKKGGKKNAANQILKVCSMFGCCLI